MIILAHLLAGLLLAADDAAVRIDTRLRDANPTVATPVALEVTASVLPEVTIVPGWPPALGPFEVLGASEQSSVLRDGQRVFKWELQLITFASGALTIPPVEVVVEDERNRTRRVASSQPMDVTVRPGVTVTPSDQLRVPLRTLTLPWTLVDAGLAAITTAIVGLVWRSARARRRRVAKSAAPPPQAAPAIPSAGRRWPTISELEAALPRTDADVPRFYEIAADVTRGAIAVGTGIPADRMSSRELIAALRSVPGQKPDQWNRLLDSIDRVRFGRHSPSLSDPARVVGAVKQLTTRSAGRSSGGTR